MNSIKVALSNQIKNQYRISLPRNVNEGDRPDKQAQQTPHD